ncbi:aldo/keto reductase [Synechococcus sp. CS-602]|uniref:aldo/keto reductase n=1 Tax=Synechococcaceae TaxID=1890426 RepID=UPI0008FF59D6|nr:MULTISPECIES: aldo/keto reductase [Synechococcaceae]MCT4364427.1 aldo/keto reductase [Candidatus Regnicoccus frigidus MAG-AL1]APD48330.1 oxidoreductase [Synechococcus sp. SynAce01]MCT0201499.1 aldo/keto reductase [Synechococcus sp. CS-603]MCT0206006.1 aldo/keto reductase [Synechococcus sp. CS-602]MCT0244930.1 aldo/keto reductase [Synechococcus sp. CS-601]
MATALPLGGFLGPDSDLPSIGVGTWAWGNQFLWGYEPERHDAALAATFQRAVDLGLTFFDTADSYGTGRFQGRSEVLLGGFLATLPAARLAGLCVATKLAPFPWRLGRSGYARAFEASRQRLGGKLDRVQLHWSTARYAPWQEGPLLEGLADLVDRQEVASLGLSNLGPRRLELILQRLAARGIPLASLQVQLSLLAPDALAPGGVAEVCRHAGVELIAYSPLALGLLSDPGRSGRPWPVGPRGWLYRRLLPRIEPLLVEMRAIAAAHGASMAEVALNWCRAHGARPIPGLRTVSQAETAAAAVGWRLEASEVGALDRQAIALPVRMPANPFQSN